MRSRILLADDDQHMIRTYELMLRSRYDVASATSVDAAKSILLNEDIDVLVTDLNFEGQDEDGLDLIDFSIREKPKVPIIVLSGDSETGRVADSMRRRILDFIAKGRSIEEGLIHALERAVEQRKTTALESKSFRYQTRSPAVIEVLSRLERVLNSKIQSPILIIGEPGTGKEHLARHIGSVTKKNVVATSMANHSRELADSELFGHTKGSFTSASANAIGLVEKANNGILFLDEIGETSLEVQAKLLRVVQEKAFTSVGNTTVKHVNLRFIAATNRNLNEMAAQGTFKKDLLERLSTWTLVIPPLRQRPEDIKFLTNVFLNEFVGQKPFQVTDDGMSSLLEYSWPGNIRELRNVMERITTLSEDGVLDRKAVQSGIHQTMSAVFLKETPAKTSRNLTKHDYISALETCEGNRSQAARLLKINPGTMFRRIREWGLHTHTKGSPGRPKTRDEEIA